MQQLTSLTEKNNDTMPTTLTSLGEQHSYRILSDPDEQLVSWTCIGRKCDDLKRNNSIVKLKFQY